MVSMEKKDIEEGFSSLKSIQEDIKRHLHLVSYFVAVILKENHEMSSDIIYITNQNGSHDSYIDYHDKDLKELMGTTDIIKEEVMKLDKMNQCNHFQESPSDEAHLMEEVSVTHLVG